MTFKSMSDIDASSLVVLPIPITVMGCPLMGLVASVLRTTGIKLGNVTGSMAKARKSNCFSVGV